jgi:hypothetical protein
MKCRQAEDRIHVVEYGNHGPLFHHDFHARRSMLNCVPDAWLSFFKITLVTPLSFFIDMALSPPAPAKVARPAAEKEIVMSTWEHSDFSLFL